MNDATLKTARDVVQSIYDTIVESAEEDDAHAKWLTADFRSGEMMYQVQLHSGVAGVGLFLADYGRILHDDRAVELAGKAMTWSQSAENAGFWTKNDSGAWRVTLAYGVARSRARLAASGAGAGRAASRGTSGGFCRLPAGR